MEAWLVNGITATVSGMLTVFLVLILIAFLISKIRHLNSKNQIMGEDSRVSLADISLPDIDLKEDDEEVVAVIMAVISAMGDKSDDKLIVRRIKRID